jgi:hypothetical protein
MASPCLESDEGQLKSLNIENANYIIINLSLRGQEMGLIGSLLLVRDKKCFYCDSFGVFTPEVITFVRDTKITF